MLLAVALHFTLVFVNAPVLKKKYALWVVYISALVFSCLSIFSDISLIGTEKMSWGWEFAYLEEGMLEYLLTGWILLVLFLIYFLLGRFYLTQKDILRRKQVIFILFAFIIMGLGIGFSQIVLISIFRFIHPDVTVPLILIAIIIIGYAMLKYKLFVVTPAQAADNIIRTISDGLLILDKDKKIKNINPSALDFLGYKKSELENEKITKIFKDKEDRKKLKEGEMQEVLNIEVTAMSKQNKKIPVILSITDIRDSKANLEGWVLVFKDISQRKKQELEIKEKNEELEKMNKFMIGREQKMIELKEEIKKLSNH